MHAMMFIIWKGHSLVLLKVRGSLVRRPVKPFPAFHSCTLKDVNRRNIEKAGNKATGYALKGSAIAIRPVTTISCHHQT